MTIISVRRHLLLVKSFSCATRYSLASRQCQPIIMFNSNNKPCYSTTTREQEEKRRRRILLNCRNRGRVETELYLGGYAQDNIWKMSSEQLNQLEQILNETDADLFLWLSDIKELPPHLKQLEIMQQILSYIRQKRSIHYTQRGAKSFNADYDETNLVPPHTAESS